MLQQVAPTLKLNTEQDGPQLDLAPGAHCNSRTVVSLAVQMLVCQTALPASSQPPVSALQPNPCKAVLQVNAILYEALTFCLSLYPFCTFLLLIT